MRDIHLHIDRDRLEMVHGTARLLDREVLFAQQFSLLLDYDPLVLYDCISHEPSQAGSATSSEFFWHDQERVIVAMGHVTRAIEVDSFEALSGQLARWREMCADRQSERALRAVGGLGFDASFRPGEDSIWRGYGPGRFWVPRCMMLGERGKHWALTLCVSIDPQMSAAQLAAHIKKECLLAEAWISGARHYNVPRETSRLGMTLEEPSREAWGNLVGEATRFMQRGPLDKVVLARRVEASFERRVRPSNVLEQLITIHPSCKVFLIRPEREEGDLCAAPARFLGASPECLVRMHAGKFYVDALAGSAPIELSDEALLASAKDRQEHALVVQEITHKLAELAQLEVGETKVDALAHIKHLRTPISGEVARGAGLSALAGALHPTPAVCGKPHVNAIDYLRAHEHGVFLERGWYTGVVGWTGLDDQHGAFYVALRCGLLTQDRATLFVGAGIMPDSSPESELAETSNKARAMTSAFAQIGEVQP